MDRVLDPQAVRTVTLIAPRTAGTESSELILRQHLLTLSKLAESLAFTGGPDFCRAADLLVECLRSGGKVLACGNGGSAADAQHFVAELVGRMVADRPPLAALSLTTDTSVLTAVGNDYGYDQVFSRQIEAIGRRGDVLVAISTSGRSPNVVGAIAAAREMGMGIVTLTGSGGHPSLGCSDAWFRIDSPNTAHVQELHTGLLHALCMGVERALFGDFAIPFTSEYVA